MSQQVLSETDEMLLLSFLRRAKAALALSSWEPRSLGLLDWYLNDGDEVKEARREMIPALADIADEWDAKFRDDLATFLGADVAGDVLFHFRTFAHSEGQYWELANTPLADLAPFPIFGLYMIREGDRTRYGDFLENIFCYPAEPEDTTRNQYGLTSLEAFFDTNEGAEMIHTGDGMEGVDWTDPEKMDSDPRYSARLTFAAPVGELVLSELEESDLKDAALAREAMLDKLADHATESAREHFQGNAYHPKAVLAA